MEILVVNLIDYILKHTFTSKRMMADALGISYRTLLNVCMGRGSTKNNTKVTSAILRYCIQHQISLESALQTY